jgi:hypothetical protein
MGAAVAGLTALSARYGSTLAVETVVSLTWLLSFLAVGASVLVCHLAATPTFRHMQWQF